MGGAEAAEDFKELRKGSTQEEQRGGSGRPVAHQQQGTRVTYGTDPGIVGGGG